MPKLAPQGNDQPKQEPIAAPTVRLFTAAKQSGVHGGLNGIAFGKPPDSAIPKQPTGQLAVAHHETPAKDIRYDEALREEDIAAPTIKLAHVHGAQGDNVLIGRHGVAPITGETAKLPALLISYYYIDGWLKNQSRYYYRDWVMDSGAFSAYNSGVEIKLQDYIDCCKRLIEADQTLKEVYALDVIGDWRQTIKNTEEMWRQGVEAIPCYHWADQNMEVLKSIARDYPKIAIGGMADLKGKQKKQFVEQCFARVWPKKIHGFACVQKDMVLGFPFHSTDATTWEIRACGFGRWAAFDGARVSVRGSKQNLRVEVEYYLELERQARERWKKEMKQLEKQSPTTDFALRLAVISSGREENAGLLK